MLQLSGHCSQASPVLGLLTAFLPQTFGFEQIRAHDLLVGFASGYGMVDRFLGSDDQSRLLLSYIHARISGNMVLCTEKGTFCP
jgi:hypothetical protein